MVKNITLMALAGLLMGTVGGWAEAPAPAGREVTIPAGERQRRRGRPQPPVQELSEAEKEGILYMREEEKLARDVYLTFSGEWSLRIFANIARSEQRHTDAIKRLIDRYNLADPAQGKGVGEFTNPELQDLYHRLVDQGLDSLEEALTVGATIEEIDIVDLQDYLAQTDQPDLQRVYGNLLAGSKNHLRAFVSVLARRGITYEPQYLSPEEYEDIINPS